MQIQLETIGNLEIGKLEIQLETIGNFYKEYTLTFMMFFVNLLCFCILVFFGFIFLYVWVFFNP